MRKHTVCRACGGNCDPGELVNGICLECMEEERVRIIWGNKAARLMNSTFYQMRFDSDGMVR